jgi:hypothetical protein
MVRIWPDIVGSRALGTASVATQLSGDRSGNATDYILPTEAKSILYVRPFLTEITPTAGQAVLATLRATSNDVPSIGNFEVLCPPLGSVLGATAFQDATAMSDPMNYGGSLMGYPWCLDVKGGEHIQFYGQTQINCTVAPRLGAQLLLADVPSKAVLGGTAKQWFYLTTSKNNNSNNPTSTGTTAATVIGQPVTLTGGAALSSGKSGVIIRMLQGVVTSGTIVASDTVIGNFYITAPELDIQVARWNMEPILGFLGTTGETNNYISTASGLYIQCQTPSTISTALTMDVAPANAGNFEVSIGYQLP